MNQVVYDLIENNQDKYEAVCRLYEWSENHEFPTPFSFFLDTIGYSKEHIGENLTSWDTMELKLGFMELSYLAAALEMYSTKPLDVVDFISTLLSAEMSE